MTKKVALTDAGDVTDLTIVVTILTNTNAIMVRNFSFSNPARNSAIAAVIDLFIEHQLFILFIFSSLCRLAIQV